jgi:hypothetical protein
MTIRKGGENKKGAAGGAPWSEQKPVHSETSFM